MSTASFRFSSPCSDISGPQFGLIFEVLDALGIAHLSVPGYEADDIIATLASQAVDAGRPPHQATTCVTSADMPATWDDRFVEYGARQRREAIRQLAELRRRLAAAEDALADALASMKRAEATFDAATPAPLGRRERSP